MLSTVLMQSLLLLGLVAVAIYVQVSSDTLSIPIPLGVRILTILLPLLTWASASSGPWLRRMYGRAESSLVSVLTPIALYVFQGVLTVVLATLSIQGSIPGPALDCSLHEAWQGRWRTHDGASLERIQDAFNCCGLNSVRDMSWPRQGSQSLCSELYHRSSACVVPWRGAAQRNSGLEFAVAVACGLVQMMQLVLPLLRRAGSPMNGPYRRLARGLVTGSNEALVAHEEGGAPSVQEGGQDGHEPGRNGYGYGALEPRPGHRVEPSSLLEDRPNWGG